ncbi:OmpH family outer membrane protein [Flavobacterium sp. LAR06]|uniref:OmpH family outer membrane protein n=1 Tax=Flavobacterium sp. LAR06 TaxID=3064897 RepID=UPI0035C0D68F
MKTSKISFIITFLFIALTFFLIGYKVKFSDRIVTVNSSMLFKGFIMTKELKRAGEKEFNVRKKELDNLYSLLRSKSIAAPEKEMIMKQLEQGKEEFEMFNKTFASNESSKIWSRIHSYTKEFSKENNYQFIISTDNRETVLFADQNSDVTKELLIYINKKYEGVK